MAQSSWFSNGLTAIGQRLSTNSASRPSYSRGPRATPLTMRSSVHFLCDTHKPDIPRHASVVVVVKNSMVKRWLGHSSDGTAGPFKTSALQLSLANLIALFTQFVAFKLEQASAKLCGDSAAQQHDALQQPTWQRTCLLKESKEPNSRAPSQQYGRALLIS